MIYNIFEEQEKGSYTPGFFLMKVSFPFDTNNLSELSPEDLGTFAHEYVHFLQNTSTPYGLWQAIIFYQSIAEFFSFVKANKPSELPVKDYSPSDTMKKRIDLEKEASGFRGFLDIPESQTLVINCNTVDVHGEKIKQITLGFQDVHGTPYNIILGANIIKESMAAMVQEIIDPESQSNHSAMPYHIVKRIASQMSLEIKDDIKKLIALCFISLHTLYPGMTLIDYMSYANNNPEKDIIAIFEHFIKDSKVHPSKGEVLTIEQLGDVIVETYKNTVQTFLYGKDSERKLEYLAEVLDRVKLSNGMIPLLRLLTEHDINAELLQMAVEACGTPVIWNDLGNISIPNTVDNAKGEEKPDMEIWALFANQSLYKRMKDKRQYVCPMYSMCHGLKLNNTKDECYDLPWQGSECIMTMIGHSLGLQ